MRVLGAGHIDSPRRYAEVIELTIDEIFAEKYGITPEGYYRQELRKGADAATVLLDINRKVNDIWKHEKGGGFYPVNETDLPDGFI